MHWNHELTRVHFAKDLLFDFSAFYTYTYEIFAYYLLGTQEIACLGSPICQQIIPLKIREASLQVRAVHEMVRGAA